MLTTLWSAFVRHVRGDECPEPGLHVDEGRSWWRVRLTAVLLTVALALFVLVSFALVLVGPTLAEKVADWIDLGAVFTWTWKIAQWPVVVALMISGVTIVYYVAPDVQQEWVWITPGSVFATIMWLLASLRVEVVSVGVRRLPGTLWRHWCGHRVVVVVLRVGLAILAGAEMNTVLEHASPEGKDPGEKVKGEKEQRAWSTPRTLVVKNPVQRSGGAANHRRRDCAQRGVGHLDLAAGPACSHGVTLL